MAKAKRTLAENLEVHLLNIHNELNEIAGALDRIGAELPELDRDGLGDLVLALDALKKDQENGLKAVNKALTAAHEVFCRELIDDNIYTYREHKQATFTASVKGHFSIKDPEAFYAWLCVNLDDVCERMEGIHGETEKPYLSEEALDKIETSLDLLLACGTRKTEMRAVCESQLENGLQLPDGVTGFVQQKVIVRRKSKKGKSDEF